MLLFFLVCVCVSVGTSVVLCLRRGVSVDQADLCLVIRRLHQALFFVCFKDSLIILTATLNSEIYWRLPPKCWNGNWGTTTPGI